MTRPAPARAGSRDEESAAAPDAGARILQGAPVARAIRDGVGHDVARFVEEHGFAPTLVNIVVGTEAASAVYLQQILRSCVAVGIPTRVIELPGSTSPSELAREIRRLNADRLVAGVIVQMPLPPHIPLRTVIDTLDPAKDIDGIHPLNMGLMTLGYEGFLPACAEAAVEMLRSGGYDLVGKRAVVIGRSNVVGKPVQLLLLREHCTVTVCHRRTRASTRRSARPTSWSQRPDRPASSGASICAPAHSSSTWASTSSRGASSATSSSSRPSAWRPP
jgi:5,10-methylene-tetrahydrofolate dehydrogenase/methenyl tetrahydrofolate cyclohydrolase